MFEAYKIKRKKKAWYTRQIHMRPKIRKQAKESERIFII